MRKKGEKMKMDMENDMVFARSILGKWNEELPNENKTTVVESVSHRREPLRL